MSAGELRTGLGLAIESVKNEHQKDETLSRFKDKNKDPYKMLLIKNEFNQSWTITAENNLGEIKTFDIQSSSALAIVLQEMDQKNISFTKRSEILNVAAQLFNRTNTKNKVTLLSNKSGHYKPEDEENYQMLKFWEKRGVDLTQTPFYSFMKGAGEVTFRSAQEYIDKIEPAILARQLSCLFIESGIIQNYTHQPLLEKEMILVMDRMGNCYSTDSNNYSISFTHPEIIMDIKLPEFIDRAMFLKTEIIAKIADIKDEKREIKDHLRDLSQLSSESPFPISLNEEKEIERNNLRIKKIDADISRLESATKENPRLGKKRIHGGGIITTNCKGEITKIDTKIGEYALSKQEIATTLKKLENQGVKLDGVRLITYHADKLIFENAKKYTEKEENSIKIKPLSLRR